jgi:hypothetical protein
LATIGFIYFMRSRKKWKIKYLNIGLYSI